MGYNTANGRYARTREVALTTAVVTTATGAIAASVTELGDANTLRLTRTTSAVAGTSPSATYTVETSQDGSTGWTSVGAFTAATAAGSEFKVFTGLARFVRVNVTAFSGTATPSVTSSISGEAL